jgi:hypothetical protein
VNVDLRLRYVVDQHSKLLSLAAPDGSPRVLAAISLDATRASPAAEQAWRVLLAEAIETAAEA